MKYPLSLLAAVMFLLASAGIGHAFVVTQTYQFTGADLMNYVFVGGADGSTSADNSLFDGGRLRRDGTNPDGALASRTYWTSQQPAFTTWATTTTDRFIGFNIWGLNGRGARWGEDYKPDEWVNHTGPAGWTPWTVDWPWGAPPAGYRTDDIVGWDANSFADGMNFQDANLASKVFTFTVDFETTDMWWGGATNGAPNSLYGPKTFWFGGWFDNDYWDTPDDSYMYEGNMVLNPVPEPATMSLLGVGLFASGLGWIRRRRRN